MSQTYIGIPQPQYDFWRESGTTDGTLPNGTNDTTKQIQRLGATVIGGANFSTLVTGVVTPVQSNIYFSLSSAVPRGQILFGDSPLSYFLQRTMPTIVNNYVDLFSLALTSGAHNLRLNVNVITSTTMSISKSYTLTISANQTSGAWRVLMPESDSGQFNSQNFEVLVNVSTSTVSFRIRRTAGSVSGTIRIRLESLGSPSVIMTEVSTTGTDANVYDNFQTISVARDFFRSNGGSTEPDGINDTTENIARIGNVKIGDSDPSTTAAALDVTGAIVHRVVSLTDIAASGAIGTAVATVDVASYINLNQTTASVNVTLPTPTDSTAGRLLIIANTGTTLFTVNSNIYVGPQTSREFVWDGSAWYPLTNNPSAIITDWAYKGTGLASSSAFSWKGNRFTPDRAVLIYSMCYYGTLVANGVYQSAVITGTASPGNIATVTKSLSFTVGASPASLSPGFVWLDFPYPVLLNVGTVYGLMLGRTDAADNYALPVYFNGGTTISNSVPMTGLSAGNGWRVADADLQVGSAIDTPGLDIMACGFRFKYVDSPF